jgi:hypothetical protein
MLLSRALTLILFYFRRQGLRRAVQPEDWGRVLSYSRFIKDLLLWTTEKTFGHLDDTALRELFLSLSHLNCPLLPNLRRLRYCSSSTHRSAYPILTLLPGPRIESILYTVDGVVDPVDLAFLRQLVQRSPNVIEFSCNGFVDASPPSQQSLQLLLDVVRSLPHLQRASVPCWAPLIRHLATIETLDALSIQSRMNCPMLEETESEFLGNVLPCRIRGMKSLSLDFEAGFQLVTFLDNFSFTDSPLESLHLYLAQSPPYTIQGPLLDAMRRSLPMTHMLHISLFSRYSTQPQCFDMSDLLDILRPSTQLLSFEALLPEFLMAKRYCLPPGDAFVDKLARRWANLQELTLAPCTDSDLSLQATNTTLRCLVSLAEFCPLLSFLRITLDATTDIPNLRELLPEERDRTNHRGAIQLELVDPSPLKKDSVAEVAGFLVEVFDEISGLVVDETSEWRDSWEEVDDVVYLKQTASCSGGVVSTIDGCQPLLLEGTDVRF